MSMFNFGEAYKKLLQSAVLLIGIFAVAGVVSFANAGSLPISEATSSFVGVEENENAGQSVAFVGDVNGDGMDDMLIGAPQNKENGLKSGAAYLVFGEYPIPEKNTSLENDDVTFLGESNFDFAGTVVAGLGDVNGDDISDFAIAAPYAGNVAGKIYLFFGKKGSWQNQIFLADANASFIGEAEGDSAGIQIAAIGDINHDGYDDFITSAPRHNAQHVEAGKVYVILGKKNGWEKNLSLADVSISFVGEYEWDRIGISVSGIGDVNGDNMPDFAIGAPYRDQNNPSNNGKVYLFWGGAGKWGKNTAVSTADASLIGESENDLLGFSLSDGGDINGDGFSDFVVKSVPSQGNIRMFIIWGKATGWAQNMVAKNFAPSFVAVGHFDNAGSPIVISDLDRDGFGDMLIAASKYNQNGNYSGKVYFVPGGNSGWGQNMPLSGFDDFMYGENAKDYAGTSVSVGDFDGDHYAEVAVSAPGNDSNKKDAGIVYLYGGPLKPDFALEISAPVGDETLVAGETYPITWSSIGPINNVKIRYSVNNGQNWELVVGSTPNDGSHDWTVPDVTSSHCLVKIEDVDFPGHYDISDAVFEIGQAFLTLTSPNGGEQWEIGTTHPVTWNSYGNFDWVKLQFSKDNGTTWDDIADETKNDGEYDWEITSDATDQYLVRIEEKYEMTLADTSDDVFAVVVPKSLTLTTPNGGECLRPDAKYKINWASTGNIDSVCLKYSVDNGETWETIAEKEKNDGSFGWQIPQETSDKCLVKITEFGGAVEDITDDVFSIFPANYVRLLSPNGGECLIAGSEYEITYLAGCEFKQVSLEYSVNNGTDWIDIEVAANTGSYLWQVPDISTNEAIVRIAGHGDHPKVPDVSDAVFSICAHPLITVMSPNGGECLLAGQEFEIQWEACCCIDTLKIQYSTDGGDDWNTVIYKTENDSSFLWTVPDVHSTECLIKVADVDCEPFDISDDTFTIWGCDSVTVLSPNGGECYRAGDEVEIRWKAFCEIDSMKIQYSTDGGDNWETIVYGTPNDSSYLWTIPENLHSDNCLIKVADLDCDPYDISDAPFTIWDHAPITVIAPNGGECLTAGDEIDIQWEACCCMDSLKIQYSLDGGDHWETIVYGTENDSSYTWTVPDTSSCDVLIKVADLDCDPYDISDAPFSIWNRAPFTVFSPNGGECLMAGDTVDISWEGSCCIDSVKIQYSVNNGEDWETIIYGAENDGTHPWIVPDVNSNNCLIKVAELDCDPYDVSDSTFTICTSPFITVMQPNGGETLRAGDQFEIRWNAGCLFDSLKIQYSLDNGANWKSIAAATVNDSSFVWTIPDTTSDSCLVKVADLDCNPADMSDDVFSITNAPPLRLVSPNGGETLSAGMDFEIKWVTAAPAPDSIKIQYSVDAGSSWITIIDCTENDSVFNWSVPALSSDSCLVKIADVDCDPFDVSDDLFIITQSMVLDIDVDVSTGAAPLRVQFKNLTAGGAVNNWIWNFGDGRTGDEREPIHIYDHPGTYTVKMKAFSNAGVDSVVKVSFIEVHKSATFARLDLMSGTSTLPDHDWSKAIDGDMHGADGTVIINSEQPQAIFCVADSNGKKISAISLLCDTGIGHEERWIHRFQVAVSNSGVEDGDFHVILDTVKTGGATETFSFEPVNATFVKLVVLNPTDGLVQLGELQIFYQENTATTVANENLLIPDKFALAQNYPNPFNPTTTIKFEVPQSCKITVAIYNLLGEEIKTLINDSVAPGKYEVVWDGTNSGGTSVASGMYFYMLTSKEFRVIKKMILSK